MKVKPYVTGTISGEDLSDESHAEKFQGLNVTMANMNTVVGMYAAAAR